MQHAGISKSLHVLTIMLDMHALSKRFGASRTKTRRVTISNICKTTRVHNARFDWVILSAQIAHSYNYITYLFAHRWQWMVQYCLAMCGCSTMVSIQVFQTWDGSSILPTRTKLNSRLYVGSLVYGVPLLPGCFDICTN